MKTAAIVLALVGLAGAGATIPLYLADPETVAASICAAWWLGLTVALGALATVMVLNVAHATWFAVFRPVASAIAATMPLLALGLLPAALVAHRVYPWAGADHGIPAEVLARIARTRPWMSPWPVVLRTVLSLGIWSSFAIWLQPKPTRGRATVASGAGIPILAITATVTPFDWMMRVEPGWTSSIYGMYVVVAGFYGATGLLAVALWSARRRGLLPPEVRADHFHAHGRLMLTAVCLTGYLGFFQLLLQWIGNLPSEVQFFARRFAGPWATASWLLVFGHFAVPFFALLSRPLKRSPAGLAAVGAGMVLMHVVDVAWLVLPSRVDAVAASALAPLAAVVGLMGAWGLWRFRVLSLACEPSRDPEFFRGAGYESP